MMRMGWSGPRRGLLLLALALVGVGAAFLGYAALHQESAPEPPHSIGQIDPTIPKALGARSQTLSPAPLGPSRPVYIDIDSIGVHSPVVPLGLAADGTLAVPQPGPDLNHAAWFENSPTPGQPGPAIIEGHVDSVEGPSVFFRLGALRPGDLIRISRAGGTRLTFRVNAVRDFKKSAFPTRLVYGGELGTPTLRLITCSDFDTSINHHIGNEVVFAQLTHTSGSH